jgi:ABC-type branched-subunit amino acid transport system ATPase component
VQPFAGQTVRENIAVGAHLKIRGRAEALAKADAVARQVGLGDRLEMDAGSLTVAGRKRLEVARALATDPKLILFDEVLAGLNPSEIRDVIPVIHAIRDAGVTILLIEHVMQAVMSLSDYTWVLNQGAIIAEGPPKDVVSDPHVIEAYVSNLRAGYGAVEVLRGIDLSISKGEIVTLLGSNGVGKTTFSAVVSGLMQPWSGSITFEGKPIAGLAPQAIVDEGLIQVPEGRHVFPNMTVRENLELGSFR